MRSYLISPALPAATLLLGMVFCLAFAQFAGLRWQQSATITLYGVLFVWVALLAWRQRRLWIRFGMIDALFWTFILLVLASLAMQGVSSPGAQKYGRYLPFMAIVPYVCGRLMRPRDLHQLSSIVASAGLVMLILAAIDYRQNAAAYEAYGRWPFFGHNYAPLLIGALLAGSLIVFYFRSLAGGAGVPQQLFRRAANLAAVGLVAVAVVWVAARGALLAGLLGTVCLALMVRQHPLSRRAMVLVYLATIVCLAFLLLPKPKLDFYLMLMSGPGSGFVAQTSPSQNEPILGAASCRPFEKGVDSVAMRWVLYQEAVVMFMNRPWWGVGAGSFGRQSCIGETGFPHSTILQALAELGVVGGLLIAGLMLAAFVSFAQKAVEVTATAGTLAAQLALALFTMYLVTDQFYGNYFMAAGSYLLAGMAAGMRSNSAWNDGVGGSNVE